MIVFLFLFYRPGSYIKDYSSLGGFKYGMIFRPEKELFQNEVPGPGRYFLYLGFFYFYFHSYEPLIS